MAVDFAKEQDEVDSRSTANETLSVSSSSSSSFWTTETKTGFADGGEYPSLLCDIKDYGYHHLLHNLEVEVVEKVAKHEKSFAPCDDDEVDTATRSTADAAVVVDDDDSSLPNNDIVMSTVPPTCVVTGSKTKKNQKKKRDIFVGLKTKYGKKNEKYKSLKRSRTSSLSSVLFQDSIMQSWKRTRTTITKRRRSRRGTAIRRAARLCATFLVLFCLIGSLLFNFESSCTRPSFSYYGDSSTLLQAHQQQYQDIQDPQPYSLPANSMLKGLSKRTFERRELTYYVEKHQTVGPKRKSFFSI